jgi:hypothetical protein
MDMLLNIPEVAEMFTTKVEALSGEDFEETLKKAIALFNTLRDMNTQPRLTDGDGTAPADNAQPKAAATPQAPESSQGSRRRSRRAQTPQENDAPPA